jgi:uncharacterized membrane protein
MAHSPAHHPEKPDKISRRRRIIRSFEAKALSHRTFAEKIADYINGSFGSIWFLVINVYWFAVWIILNINVIPGVVPFDPFPFGFLTMVVSLEAIVLSIFVLLSQNRAAQTASLREELHLQVNLIAEEEITKVLELLSEIRTKVGIKRADPELEKMLERIDTSYIERALQKQVESNPAHIMHLINPTNIIPHEKSEAVDPKNKT